MKPAGGARRGDNGGGCTLVAASAARARGRANAHGTRRATARPWAPAWQAPAVREPAHSARTQGGRRWAAHAHIWHRSTLCRHRTWCRHRTLWCRPRTWRHSHAGAASGATRGQPPRAARAQPRPSPPGRSRNLSGARAASRVQPGGPVFFSFSDPAKKPKKKNTGVGVGHRFFFIY